ncbi:MAG TPA: amidase [Candidatus Limnocylindrales bacterium]|nr:amidase [Candidatus Limnocylindrales bacterium]
MKRTVMATELWRMGALDLAAAIRSRQVSSREVVEAHLRRIDAINPAVNAVTVVLAVQAFDAAEAADRAVAAGADLGRLHGVPFTVKGNIDLAGTATTWGARVLAGAYPKMDAPVVERMRAAGAIPIGHTNLPTFAVRWHTDSELWGATINPWDRTRTPGASSGGEAVALSTGMSPLGLGNDTLGSLRWPAGCCGVLALKPTLGRIPNATTVEPVDGPIGGQLAGVQGPMGRRIGDLCAAYEILSGPTWRDPWTVPVPLRGPEPARPVRVALVLDPAGQRSARQVRDGLLKAAAALQDAGYVVDEVEPPAVDAAARTLLDMLNPPGAGPEDLELAFPSAPPDTKRFLVAFYQAAGDPDPTTMRTFATRQALQRAWGRFQETHPLILAPIYTDVPFRAGTDLDEGHVAETIRGMPMTLAVNALGLPAVAVPVGDSEGLPQSVQLIGARYREDLCLDAAAAIGDRIEPITPIDPQ